jgi:N-acetylglucosamine-6-sulfatase
MHAMGEGHRTWRRGRARLGTLSVVAVAAMLASLVAAATLGGSGPSRAGTDEAVAAPTPVGAEAAPPRESAAPGDRPNIVVITTDDQDLASVSRRTMPNVTRLLKGPGTTFTDYVASGPLCCPARAVALTGQYGHNNGVTWNNPGYSDLVDKDNTLPTWLRGAGYRTAHVGMYLNGYSGTAGPDAVAPGWHEWHTMVDDRGYYDYVLHVNGRRERYGGRPGDYVTRVYNRKAVNMIDRYAGKRKPLFLSLDQRAPHGGPGGHEQGCVDTATPDPRDADRFRNERLPRPPSFDESDVSDKPSFISSRPRLPKARVEKVARDHRCRLASLRGVDRGIGEIHDALRSEGELDDTVIVFTSDNGYYAGQHRIPEDKVVPYEEAIRLPLIVRAPPGLIGSRTPGTVRQPVANIDLAPTILELAGASPCAAPGDCRTLDGRSFLDLLGGNQAGWPDDRGVLLEMEVPSQRAGPHTPCDYEGIRAGGRVYIEHHSSTRRRKGHCSPREETEYYDLRRDPFQLRNLAPSDPSSAEGRVERRLAERLSELEDCAGVAGRDPQQAGRSFCE